MSNVIVVGLDGSSASRRALSWALAEAQRRSCGVEVVTAFSDVPTNADQLSRAGATRVQAVAQGELVPPGYDRPVSFQTVDGAPAEVLVRLSERAQLVVIGSHAVTGLLHSAMLPVSELVAQMASCAVVVVPPKAHALPSHDRIASHTTAVRSSRTAEPRS